MVFQGPIPGTTALDFLRCTALSLLEIAPLTLRYVRSQGWKASTAFPVLPVVVAGLCWQVAVARWVPEPYLDEVFHIPQAQKYCQGLWSEWDDKITTPPGLYILSWAIHRAAWLMPGACSATTLRMTNCVAITLLALVAVQCRRLVEARLAQRDDGGGDDNASSSSSSAAAGPQQQHRPSLSAYALHTGLNIALFPLLFFFSALYYTDVFSTLAVLAAFWNHLVRVGARGSSLASDVCVVLLGVGSLLMRQTNVFWVVVFMGGLEAVHAVTSLRPPPTKPGPFDRETMVKFYLERYALGEIHDPPLNEANLDDVFFCALSIAIAVICNPLRVIKQIWAHVAVMGLFAAFVLWNGSVVLGDKANHVATIHLPQMLYIWPLFAFFSAPLILVPWVPTPILNLLFDNDDDEHPQQQQPRTRTQTHKPAKPAPSTPITLLNLLGYAALVPISLAIIHFNTIIHPFTLADNRHYMFYIFRHTILRAGVSPTHLAPAYLLSGIACLKTLGGRSAGAPSLSTALLWVLAAALSLVTAPLVEPRYFILPWVLWRLLLPASRALGRRRDDDLRAWLETAWFAAVNLATMYVFITRPFYWYGPDGEVADGGRAQRFMW